MTTNETTAEGRLARLGLHLPDAPTPFGAYVPAVQTGNLLFLSGMLATSGHTATAVGVVGKDLDGKAGREAAPQTLVRSTRPASQSDGHTSVEATKCWPLGGWGPNAKAPATTLKHSTG